MIDTNARFANSFLAHASKPDHHAVMEMALMQGRRRSETA